MSFTFFQLVMYFFIYSFLGWCMETAIFSFKAKKFINRGFLNGPLCPIYGFGMVIIILLLTPIEDNVYLIFFIGGFLATTLEYLTGWILEVIFKTRWWDYSHRRYNVEGYICLANSFYWAILSVIMMRLVQPYITDFVNLIPDNLLSIIDITFLLIITVDFIVTVIELVKIRDDIEKLSIYKNQLLDELKAREWFQYLEGIGDSIKLHRQLIDEALNERVEEFNKKSYQLFDKANFIQKRILKAFPNVISFHGNKKEDKKD